MRWRYGLVALVVVGVPAFAGVLAFAGIAQPNASCSLPGNVPCLTDPECSPYGATCDVAAGACVCPTIDGGAGDGGDGGGGVGGGGGGGGGGAGSGGGGGSTSVGGTGPHVGGG